MSARQQSRPPQKSKELEAEPGGVKTSGLLPNFPFEHVIALDISTKTGVAYFRNGQLVSSTLATADKPTADSYPSRYVEYASLAVVAIQRELNEILGRDLLINHTNVAIVIEETNLGRSRYTQKLLEFIHHAFLSSLPSRGFALGSNVFYVNTSDWRKVTNVQLTSEDRKQNKALRAGLRGGKSKKEIGIKGKITKKHVSVRTANELYGLALKVKDNDIADAICVGHAFIKGVPLAEP